MRKVRSEVEGNNTEGRTEGAGEGAGVELAEQYYLIAPIKGSVTSIGDVLYFPKDGHVVLPMWEKLGNLNEVLHSVTNEGEKAVVKTLKGDSFQDFVSVFREENGIKDEQSIGVLLEPGIEDLVKFLKT